jgi:hypothetical protein
VLKRYLQAHLKNPYRIRHFKGEAFG